MIERFRMWLIERLARDNIVAINCTIRDNAFVIHSIDRPFLIKNCHTVDSGL